MINVIWQTIKTENGGLSDETYGQYEYITKVIFKNIQYVNHFDNKKYSTFLDNSIIIYSEPLFTITPELKKYLDKFNSLKLNYILLHLSNESLNHNYDYYFNAKHVFRFYYDSRINNSNVTTLPLGFVTGYMNNKGLINLSNKRNILVTFIGHVKSDRQQLINNISDINNSFLHLTTKWNCPTAMTVNEVIEIYKKTLFIPCPMGWINPDSLRIFEALEWGCIPIIKRYNGVDYFKNIFGDHPLPVINDWNEIKNLMETINNEYIDSTITNINIWYKNFMKSVSNNVSNIINEKLKNNNS